MNFAFSFPFKPELVQTRVSLHVTADRPVLVLSRTPLLQSLCTVGSGSFLSSEAPYGRRHRWSKPRCSPVILTYLLIEKPDLPNLPLHFRLDLVCPRERLRRLTLFKKLVSLNRSRVSNQVWRSALERYDDFHVLRGALLSNPRLEG